MGLHTSGRHPRLTALGVAIVAAAIVTGAGAATGDLDPTFGSGGTVVTDFAATPDFAEAVAVQPDGKVVVAGSVGLRDSADFAVARYNTDGSLDQSFGAGGKVRTDFGTLRYDVAAALSLQPDGKIVVAGYSDAGAGFALARYNTDGSLDTSFGSDGRVVTPFHEPVSGGFVLAEANGVAIQPDGKIVAVGTAQQEFILGLSFVALARYNADGSLDSSFGTGGTVLTGVGFGPGMTAGAVGVAIDDRGGRGIKILAAARVPSTVASNFDFALFRYDADGSLDSTFGTGGKVTTDFGSGSDDVPAALALEPSGRVVVVGGSNAAGNGDFALARFRSDGSLDSSFGTGGRVLTGFDSGSSDRATAVSVQRDGHIVTAGGSNATGTFDFALARYKANGSLDPSFGSDGEVLTGFGTSGFDIASGVAIGPDRKIVAAGFSNANASDDFDFALARYTAR